MKAKLKVHDTLPSQDASILQVLDSYLNQYWRFAPDMIILEMRSDVKVRVTLKWFTLLNHQR